MDASGLPDLASVLLGGAVVAVNDEFFAPAANLVEPHPPVFRPGEFTTRGKWMDGWETRRRREPGHDWCILRLGLPGVIRLVVVDTTHFEGNYPEAFSLEGSYVEGTSDPESWSWFEISPRRLLEGNKVNAFEVGATFLASHLRLNIYPDGGIARLRAHGLPVPEWGEVGTEPVELASHAGGGVVVDCSDRFFSAPGSILQPPKARGMWDGWETRRRRGPGHDWVVVRLGAAAILSRLTIDTTFFKGNAPGACSVDAALALEEQEAPWQTILPESPIEPDTINEFDLESRPGPFSHVRLNIHPDGGLARFRVVGSIPSEELARKALQRFNLLAAEAAEAQLMTCCRSPGWAAAVAAARPVASVAELVDVAERIWAELGQEAWLAAAESHPRIGERFGPAERDKASRFRLWSAREQSGVDPEETATLERLRDSQQAYEHQFGHRFIVFASGRSAREIAELLEERLGNDPETERRITGEELAKITRLRLHRLMGSEGA